LEPNNSQSQDSKVDKLNKYTVQLNIQSKNDIFFCDDGPGIIKTCQEAGYLNAREVAKGKTLKQNLEEILVILKNDLAQNIGQEKSAKQDQTRKDSEQGAVLQSTKKSDLKQQSSTLKNVEGLTGAPGAPAKNLENFTAAPGAVKNSENLTGAPGAPPVVSIQPKVESQDPTHKESQQKQESAQQKSIQENPAGKDAQQLSVQSSKRSDTKKQSETLTQVGSFEGAPGGAAVPSIPFEVESQDPTHKESQQQQQSAQKKSTQQEQTKKDAQVKSSLCHDFIKDLEAFSDLNGMLRAITVKIATQSTYKFNTRIEGQIKDAKKKIMADKDNLYPPQKQLEFYETLKKHISSIRKHITDARVKNDEIEIRYAGELLKQSIADWDSFLIQSILDKIERRITTLKAVISQSATTTKKEVESTSKGQEILYQKNSLENSTVKVAENPMLKAADDLFKGIEKRLDTKTAASFMVDIISAARHGDGKSFQTALMKDNRKFYTIISERNLNTQLESLFNELKTEGNKKTGKDLEIKFNKICVEQASKPNP